MKKLLTCVLLFIPFTSLFAAGMGDARGASALGEPLRVMVPVTYQGREEFQTMRLEVMQVRSDADSLMDRESKDGGTPVDGSFIVMKVPETDGRRGYFIVKNMDVVRGEGVSLTLRLSFSERGSLQRTYRLPVPLSRDAARRALPESDAVMAYGGSAPTVSQNSFTNADAERFAEKPVRGGRAAKAAPLPPMTVPAGLPNLPDGVVRQP